MIYAVHKAKQYLPIVLKLVILATAFSILFYGQKSEGLLELAAKYNFISFTLFLFGFLMACLNWFFEILKWQILLQTSGTFFFKVAMEQSLASLTVSLATPNRIGEYGAKALFFPKSKRKKILLLNFFHNASQMLWTLLFGCFGLVFLLQKYELPFIWNHFYWLPICLFLVSITIYFLRKKEWLFKGFSVEKFAKFWHLISVSTKVKTIVLSMAKYMTFTTMFYGLLLYFGAEISIWEFYPLIFCMYFFVSVLPSYFLFDVVVRGGVSVWLFSLAGVPELPVILTVTAMWVFNFVLPALIGSYYVLAFKMPSRCS